ncbi:hypothetical protein GU243_18305 [Pseudarthrobacter psychrotolerans]|uniref:Uncharacterized protein n=1 Tax=Pseudarthrobacter psychrotolerans TaxID=2697569 RepID=A0A6P1NTI1_9MICC|nr:hypothetical protein GU243_18305 [Pseudarthrobacter psychrotolerans]
MEIRLHPAGSRPGKARRQASDGWRAGLPVKRFFTRFRSLADLPPEDLDFLSERIRLALDLSQEANMTALHAAVRAELRNRETETDD